MPNPNLPPVLSPEATEKLPHLAKGFGIVATNATVVSTGYDPEGDSVASFHASQDIDTETLDQKFEREANKQLKAFYDQFNLDLLGDNAKQVLFGKDEDGNLIPRLFIDSHTDEAGRTRYLVHTKNDDGDGDSSLLTILNLPRSNLQKAIGADNVLQLPAIFAELMEIHLRGNELTLAPDVGKNPELRKLDLSNNKLTKAPDVSGNPELQWLSLSHNKLAEAPDVSRNPELQQLYLSNNQLAEAPDVSGNPELQWLSLNNNQLTKAPDVSGNPELQWLSLSHNKLTEAPDVSRNPELQKLYLSNNKLTKAPDVSGNPELQWLSVSNNQLSEDTLVMLDNLRAKRPSLVISDIDYESF